MILPVVGDNLNRRELSESRHARVRMRVVPQTHSQYACRALIRRVGKIYTFHLAIPFISVFHSHASPFTPPIASGDL